MTKNNLCVMLAWLAAGAGSVLVLKKTGGVATLLLATIVLLAMLVIVRLAIEILARFWKPDLRFDVLRKLPLAACAVMFSVIAFEGFLHGLAWLRPREQVGQTAQLTMPEEWKVRPVTVAGADKAIMWHNKLHVFNADAMRLAGSFAPKQPDTFRVLVLGDSLTYGYGVAVEETYCSVLQQRLGKRYRIEFLNLGQCGAQSEDIFNTLATFLPKLQPDLVLYGMCLNDFLPTYSPQYKNNMAWSIWFPFQKHLTQKTLVGGFLAKKYDDVLIAMGVRADFYTDILRDFHGYQERFGRDVKNMNDLVLAQGLPPILALVLHQDLHQEQCLQIIAMAEKQMAQGGLQVIASSAYVTPNLGKELIVSPWERHPNEEAHLLFSSAFEPCIEKTPGLARFKLSQPDAND